MILFALFHCVTICSDSTKAMVGQALTPKLESKQWHHTVLLDSIVFALMHFF